MQVVRTTQASAETWVVRMEERVSKSSTGATLASIAICPFLTEVTYKVRIVGTMRNNCSGFNKIIPNFGLTSYWITAKLPFPKSPRIPIGSTSDTFSLPSYLNPSNQVFQIHCYLKSRIQERNLHV